MKRFILLTFGFLGWVFYEMSGGSDFEPASERHARLNPAPVVTEEAVPAAPVTEVAEADVIDTDPPETEVTRVSLNLTTLEEATEAAEPEEPQPAQAPTVSNIDPVSGVAVNTDTTTQSADTPAIIPSLIAPGEGTQTVLDTGPVLDVRTVSGNRVNVRGGPSTDFNVVFRMTRGEAVEVLEENGDGWVRMRSVESGEEGWMADFLLTAG